MTGAMYCCPASPILFVFIICWLDSISCSSQIESGSGGCKFLLPCTKRDVRKLCKRRPFIFISSSAGRSFSTLCWSILFVWFPNYEPHARPKRCKCFFPTAVRPCYHTTNLHQGLVFTTNTIHSLFQDFLSFSGFDASAVFISFSFFKQFHFRKRYSRHSSRCYFIQHGESCFCFFVSKILSLPYSTIITNIQAFSSKLLLTNLMVPVRFDISTNRSVWIPPPFSGAFRRSDSLIQDMSETIGGNLALIVPNNWILAKNRFFAWSVFVVQNLKLILESLLTGNVMNYAWN